LDNLTTEMICEFADIDLPGNRIGYQVKTDSFCRKCRDEEKK